MSNAQTRQNIAQETERRARVHKKLLETRVTFEVEVTDTFGGEANYCWVRRYTVGLNGIQAQRQSTVMRHAKRAAGYTGIRGVTRDIGDCFEFRPYGACIVMFVTERESDR